MAEEQKVAEATVNGGQNVTAEQDVKDVLAELKGEEAGKPESTETKVPESRESENGQTDADKKEEEKIIAAANKLGQEAVSKEQQQEQSSSEQHRGRGQTNRGRGGKRINYRDNIKSDATTLGETSDPVEIRKQVEFYFSDSNLPMDKFLLSKVGGSENRAVELSLLHSFKRMRRFQPFSAIVDALKDSESLNLTENNTCVQRKTPLPENFTESLDSSAAKVFEDKAMHRTIYAKGFGAEEPSTQFDIEAFFTPYGPTNAVRLRRTPDKKFKGSVFVEFDSEEGQKAFLNLDPKPKWKGTTELLIKSKREYCDEKVKEIEAGRLKPTDRSRGRGNHRGRGRGRGDNRNRNDRDWRDRRAEDQKKGFQDKNEKDSRGVPVIKSGNDKPASKPTSTTEAKSDSQENKSPGGQKRSLEEDTNGNANERSAKKVDVKA